MDFDSHIEVIEDFIYNRNTIARQNLYSFFDLIRLNSLETIAEPADAGIIRVEGLRTDTTHYALLNNSIPSTIIAEPKPGYTFVGWTGVESGTDPVIEVILTENSTITAKFRRNEFVESSDVVINEINYNSSDTFDPRDWVELYNNSGSAIDLTGWYFSDSNNDHQFFFPEGYTLEENAYVVLSRDTVVFKTLFPEVSNVLGDMDFGLSGSGEQVRIYNDSENLIDQLVYSDSTPWPEDADGNGSTLSLTHPDLDNSLAENWAASIGIGTPGEYNSDVLVSAELETSVDLPKGIILEQNFPNPFNPTTVISYQVADFSDVSLRVYDALGREVASLVDEYQQSGAYQVVFDASSLSSGVYIYQLRSGFEVITKKMLLVLSLIHISEPTRPY